MINDDRKAGNVCDEGGYRRSTSFENVDDWSHEPLGEEPLEVEDLLPDYLTQGTSSSGSCFMLSREIQCLRSATQWHDL